MTELTATNVENTDVKDLAKIPEKPKPLTKQEVGKLRRHYITKVHSKVITCGHVYVPEKTPRHTNCESCWEAFFHLSANLTVLHDELMKNGKQGLNTKFGKKFTRAFDRFLTAQLYKEANENNNERNGSDGDSANQHSSSHQCDSGTCGQASNGETVTDPSISA